MDTQAGSGTTPLRWWSDADLLRLVKDPDPVPIPTADFLKDVWAEIWRREREGVWTLSEVVGHEREPGEEG